MSSLFVALYIKPLRLQRTKIVIPESNFTWLQSIRSQPFSRTSRAASFNFFFAAAILVSTYSSFFSNPSFLPNPLQESNNLLSRVSMWTLRGSTISFCHKLSTWVHYQPLKSSHGPIFRLCYELHVGPLSPSSTSASCFSVINL